MIKKRSLTYPCHTGREKRRLYVYLPRGYESQPDKRYPVLYMFDGQNVFFDDNATYGKSWGMGEYLNQTKTQLIVAAFQCNTHADNGRLSEYSPFYYHPGGSWGGPYEARARETMHWYISKLKPYIDQRFRTLPDREHTFIGGSSMGGLMSLYAVLRHNDVFSRAASFSPSIDVDANALLQLIYDSSPAPDTVIYMDYGTKELEYEPWTPENFARVSNALMDKGIILSTRLVPDGDHSEASWERQLPFAIPTIMYNINQNNINPEHNIEQNEPC